MAAVLLFFVKWPEPGRVKTRLAATVGPLEAARIYRRLVATVCGQIPAGTQVLVCFDPPQAEESVRAWLAPLLAGKSVRFVAQCEGGLGARLTHAFTFAFASGFSPVSVIGSDCVELCPAIFEEAAQAMEAGCDGAIGPSEDGGYYLLALRKPCPGLFEHIAWSTEGVFGQTLERAGEHGVSLHRLPTLRDVDTEADWNHARAGIEN